MTFQQLKTDIRLMDPSRAIESITIYLNQHPSDTQALTLRGMKYFGMGKRAEAINDYLAALEIDPDCSARLALQSANEILDFYNKDLFNP